MMPRQITATFQAAAEDTAEFLNLDHVEVRSYSGRGMYGRECLAVVLPSYAIPMFAASLVVVASARYDDDGEDVRDFLAGDVRTDDMGHEKVLYFPRLGYVEAEEPEAPPIAPELPYLDTEPSDT